MSNTALTLFLDNGEFQVVASQTNVNEWKIWMENETLSAVLVMLHEMYYQPKVVPKVKASLVGGGILDIEESKYLASDVDGYTYLVVITAPQKRSLSVSEYLREQIFIRARPHNPSENDLVVFGVVFTEILNDLSVQAKLIAGVEKWLEKIEVDLRRRVLVPVRKDSDND